MTDDWLRIPGDAHIKFESITSVIDGKLECWEGVLHSVLSRSAMSEQQRPRHCLIEIEVADRLGVRRLLGLLHGFLELLLEQGRFVLLGFH